MTDPYKPPASEHETDSPSPGIGSLRHLFFGVNFSVTTLIASSCLINVMTDRTSPDFVASMILLIPIFGYGGCEWLAFYRDKRNIERKLGIGNVTMAVFFAFGLLAGVGEALMSGKPQDAEYVMGFIAAFSVIAAYLFWCGKCRMRLSPALRKIHEIQDD